MKTDTTTIYIGTWNNREFAFALDKERAKSLVESHWAFGDPSEDESALGNEWASEDQSAGWKILEMKLTVPVINVEIKTSGCEDTEHVVWKCPYCNNCYSDEWRTDDELPVLLGCGCDDASRYLLGVSSLAGS